MNIEDKPKKSSAWIIILVGVLLAGVIGVAVAATLILKMVPEDGDATADQATVTEAPSAPMPEHGTHVFGTPGAPLVNQGPLDKLPIPSLVADIHAPQEVKNLLLQNEWLQDVISKPLGRGFLGSWAGFLATEGEEMGGGFQGRVLDLLLDQVLAEPFRLVWFAGRRGAGVPAVVIPEPSDAARSAFAALDAIAQRGTMNMEKCLASGEAGTDGPVVIKRWLLADHAIYASLQDERLVLGRRATAVMQGACAKLQEMHPQPNVALDLIFDTTALGREAQLLQALLGLTSAPRLAFGIEGGKLVPRGINANITAGRLGKAALSAEAFRAIPEDAPVVMVLQVLLPEQLTADSLRTHFEKGGVKTKPREVALVWYPHADPHEISDISLLWSDRKDAEALRGIFSGAIVDESASCKLVIIASNQAAIGRSEASCKGKKPSLQHGAQAVVKGFKQPHSIGVGVHLGRLLSGLTIETFRQENAKGGKLPAEIEEAKTQLEALPFLGFSGSADGDTLKPGGFRS